MRGDNEDVLFYWIH